MKKLFLTMCIAVCACMAQAKEVGLGGTVATASGSVTKGTRSVIFIFSADYTGTVAGIAFTGATDSSFSPPLQTGDTNAAIAYVVTTGSIRIMTTR